MITFVLVRKQRMYTAPSGNDLVWELILSKNMVAIRYMTEVVTRFMCHLLFQVDSLKEICGQTLRNDIDNDTVLLCLGVAEQFSVPRLKVRTIDFPYCNYKLKSWSKASLISFFFCLCRRRKTEEL